MATPIIMPRQGQSVESCIITKWHKKKGDKVSLGEILFSYETDKAAFDEEAKAEGILLESFFEEGDDVECLLNVCVIGEAGEDASSFNPNNTQKEQKSSEVKIAEPEKSEIKQTGEVTAAITGEIKISPRAKNLAKKQGLDYSYAEPTGPNGRIIERDIHALSAKGIKAPLPEIKEEKQAAATTVQVSAAEFEEVKLPNIRKVIAKAMHASLANSAQLTLNSSFDATNILNLRQTLKDNKDTMGLENITLNDIVCYAAAKTLLAHKDLNAHFYDDKMVYWKHVHLGVAIDTPRGLIVPTIFNADTLSLNEFSQKAKDIIKAAQSGSISPDLTKGGSFTVTNLGSLGIESFTPVINPPQTGILGVNNIETKIKDINGEIKYYPAMALSLTFDHRALDGAPAAKFLKELCTNLENFTLLLIK